MSEIVLRELAVIVNSEIKTARGKLEVEESGRVVASLQGNVSGWRQLLDFLTAEFVGFSVITIGLDGSQIPVDLADLTDADVFKLESLVVEFKETPEWSRVLGRVDERIEHLKDELLFRAEKSRELDLCQGQYKALIRPRRFFMDVSRAATMRREKIAEDEKRKREELNFDGNPETPPPLPAAKATENRVVSTCPNCGGTCYTGSEDNREPCEVCGGTGAVYSKPTEDTRVTCPDCKGTGNVQGLDMAWGACLTCHSTGKVDAPKEGFEDAEHPGLYLVTEPDVFPAEYLRSGDLGTWEWTPDQTLATPMLYRVAEEAVRQCGGEIIAALN